jgi:uncharacterized membrane protein
MGIKLRHRSPSGETRPWTLREIVQGKPIDRPTHPMVIHFPIAFYVGALAFDVMSRVCHFPSAPLAATWLIIGAFAGTALAVPTGLVDRSTMKPGTRTRTVATRHMLIQLTAAAVFVLNLAVRWSDRHAARSKPLWIALDALGVLLVTVGADLGGQLVYKMGFRVE